jgi:hypothetical protein
VAVTIPSIKGRILSVAIEDAQKLVAAGTVKRGELERWLRPEDLALFEKPLAPVDWYDIRSYARVCELLRDVEGEGRDEYLHARGFRTGERLLEGGLYAQLEYVTRMKVGSLREPIDRYQAFGRDLKLLVTISSSIMNFSKWSSRPDEDHELRYVIDVTEAADFPEVLGWTSLGFVNCMARAGGGGDDVWRWERVDAENLAFRMNRPL